MQLAYFHGQHNEIRATGAALKAMNSEIAYRARTPQKNRATNHANGLELAFAFVGIRGNSWPTFVENRL
jgi:hypothetical protein